MELSEQRGTDVLGYKPPIPSRELRKSVWADAEEHRKKFGLSNGFDLSGLIPEIGGKIAYIGMFDEDQTDAIVVEPTDSFVIHLSSETSA